MAALGNLDVLCACGRMLHVPTEVVFVRADRGDHVIGKVELDHGYLYAHAATWHRTDDTGQPTPHARLHAAG